MASVNKVILIGNLGRDPELRHTPSGAAVCNFSIATSEKWKDKDGNSKDRTEWHNIVLWNRTAEVANEYLKKGSSVFIEGRLQYRSYDDADGNKKYTTEIIGDRLQFIGSKDNNNSAKSEPQSAQDSGTPAQDSDFPF